MKNPEENKIIYSGVAGRLCRGGNETLKGVGNATRKERERERDLQAKGRAYANEALLSVEEGRGPEMRKVGVR